MQILLTLLLVLCTPLIQTSSAEKGGALCHTGFELKTCNLCGDVFGEFETEECCRDAVLNTLCHSLVETARDNKRSFVGMKRRLFGKKSRNTFLGKRFSDVDVTNNKVDALEDAAEKSREMTSEEVLSATMSEKRSRNNFLGKRSTRSVASQPNQAVPSKLHRLLQAFERAIETQVLLEEQERNKIGNTLSSQNTKLETTEKENQAASAQLDRQTRGKNTFLGKRAVSA